MTQTTYSEYLLLQKGEAPPRDPHASGVRVYADTDGAIRSVQSDGTDSPVGGGGMVPSDNWCQLSLDSADALTVGSSFYLLQESDLSITRQSGTDFSIGDTTGFPVSACGALISATGGWFQAAVFAASPGGISLDGGSTDPRWMEFFYSIGLGADSPFEAQALGVDIFFPVVDSNGDLADTRVSVPGYAAPGHPMLFRIGFELLNGTGTDTIGAPLANFGKFIVWQIA